MPQPPAELEKMMQRHPGAARVMESESSWADAPSESEPAHSQEITMTEVQPSEADEHSLSPLLDSSTSNAIRAKLPSDDEIVPSSMSPAISHTQTPLRTKSASATYHREPIALETSIGHPGRRTEKVEDEIIDSDDEYCPMEIDACDSTSSDSSDSTPDSDAEPDT